MKIEAEFTHRGEQVRRYGPDQFEFVLTITPPATFDDNFEYGQAFFERYAKALSVNWKNPGEGDWYSWTLRKIDRLDKNKWYFLIERPYDD